MKALVVLAHPERNSFNGAMCDAAMEALAESGHEVVLSDLYRENFDVAAGRGDFRSSADPAYLSYQAEQRNAVATNGFAEEIAREQARLRSCDIVIFQFPLWWFGPPAILKGWFDRVLACGFAYGGGRWFETAPLRGRRALLSLTMGAKSDRWGPDKLFGPLEWCLHPIHVGALNFCGFDVLAPQIVHAPASASGEEREILLQAWRNRCKELPSETPLPFRRTTDFQAGAHRDQ